MRESWPRLSQDGWAYILGGRCAHYLEIQRKAEDGTVRTRSACGLVGSHGGPPYAADPAVPRCINCQNALSANPRPEAPPVKQERVWAFAPGLTRGHYWHWERLGGGLWRSACGIQRAATALDTETPVDLDQRCRKCREYAERGEAAITADTKSPGAGRERLGDGGGAG